MNGNRLDQILMRLGYATEAQITEALRTQKSDGGRLGTHLMRSGSVTADQLSRALSEQYGVPAFSPGRHRVAPDLVARFPAGFIRTNGILPMGFDASNGVLSLVTVDPGDAASLAEVRSLIDCFDVEIFVTPEATFDGLVAQFVPEDDGDQAQGGIALPDLFGLTIGATADAPPAPESVHRLDDAAPEVLMVSDQVFLKNFLDPIFEREGYRLVTASERGEVGACLHRGRYEHVLVDGAMAPTFQNWIRQGAVPVPRGEVGEFSTISGALFDNPVPYAGMHQSLVQSLKLVAEAQLGRSETTPPFDLLCSDCRELAATVELNRLAIDGLELAALLIVAAPTTPGAHDHGIDWPRTLGHARALRFPWDLEGVLKAFRELLSERVHLDEFGSKDQEIAVAAQVLAIVWHHHRTSGRSRAAGDDASAAKARLRGKSGLLAGPEIIESYVGLLERTDMPLHAAAYHQLLIVGQGDPLLQQFTTRLRHLGYHTVFVDDLEEAKAMCRRHSPSAVFLHDAGFPEAMAAGREQFTAEGPLLVYAVTTAREPTHILELFDAGFDDVYALPHEFDIIAARVRKSLKALLETALDPATSDGFRAAFTALGFTDLLQALSQSLKTVRIALTRGNGDDAVVHLDRGRLSHAVCGGAVGDKAIYEIVGWEEDGEFRVEPVETCPVDNISLPLESILMEGCRLLDESRV